MVIDAEQIPLAPRISLQSLGVSHMKLGAEAELRSLIRTQSVTLQVLGFVRTNWLHRAVLVEISWKDMNGL